MLEWHSKDPAATDGVWRNICTVLTVCLLEQLTIYLFKVGGARSKDQRNERLLNMPSIHLESFYRNMDSLMV